MAWEIIVYEFIYCYCRQKRRKYHLCTYTEGDFHSFQGSPPTFVSLTLWSLKYLVSLYETEHSCIGLFCQLSKSYFKQNPGPKVKVLIYFTSPTCKYRLWVKFWTQLHTVTVCVISLDGTRHLMGELLNKCLRVWGCCLFAGVSALPGEQKEWKLLTQAAVNWVYLKSDWKVCDVTQSVQQKQQSFLGKFLVVGPAVCIVWDLLWDGAFLGH